VHEIVIPATSCNDIGRRARENMSTTSVDKPWGKLPFVGIFRCFSVWFDELLNFSANLYRPENK